MHLCANLATRTSVTLGNISFRSTSLVNATGALLIIWPMTGWPPYYLTNYRGPLIIWPMTGWPPYYLTNVRVAPLIIWLMSWWPPLLSDQWPGDPKDGATIQGDSKWCRDPQFKDHRTQSNNVRLNIINFQMYDQAAAEADRYCSHAHVGMLDTVLYIRIPSHYSLLLQNNRFIVKCDASVADNRNYTHYSCHGQTSCDNYRGEHLHIICSLERCSTADGCWYQLTLKQWPGNVQESTFQLQVSILTEIAECKDCQTFSARWWWPCNYTYRSFVNHGRCDLWLELMVHGVWVN